ncbi:unnamed protein product [Phytomonas sp. Hart1]|nr:unnamed protein product [Phytomonas sp. Hart1]|eukprot:CCW70270.1 unnamed protein product [Phytomonas sp. isolate Hart1]
MYYSRFRNHSFAIALVAGITSIVLLWLVLRRSGFNTTYSRCNYLSMMGEYKQHLSAGSFPSNVHLPPHLRLDKLSYLDLAETELALPPTIDLSITEKDQICCLENQLGSTERKDVKMHFGPLRSHTVVMTPQAMERYVRRRMGSQPENQAVVEEEKVSE